MTRGRVATKPDPEALSRFQNYPTLTFWYGLSYVDLAAMPGWLRDLYYEQLPGLIAQRQLLGIEVSSFPYMEDSDRSSAVRKLQRQAEVADVAAKSPAQIELSPEEYAEHMAGAGIPVYFAPKPDAEEVT